MTEDLDEGTKLIIEEITAMIAELKARPERSPAPVSHKGVEDSEANLSNVEKYTREIDTMVEACFKDRRLAVLIDRAIRDAMRESADWL